MGLGSPFTTGAGANDNGRSEWPLAIHDLVLGRSFYVLNCHSRLVRRDSDVECHVRLR